MTDRTSDGKQPGTPALKTRSAEYVVLGAVCALVIGVYAWSAKSGWLELGSRKADNTYYNLLVQGFRAGDLHLKREVPPGLAQLADPYDPTANGAHLSTRYPLFDLSYYKGKLYLYFGVTPALVLFWPYAVLTGHYLLHKEAAVIFFSVSFLASVGLLWAVWRRYFAEVSLGVMAAGVLAIGLANFTLAILQRCDVYEAAISCGCALTMLSLLAIWKAMHAVRGRAWWLVAASLGYGLAVGARPSLVFGAIVLLVPMGMVCRAKTALGQRVGLGTLLAAATGPIAVIGLGLLVYNFLRFDDSLEFGQRYQLPVSWHQQFSLGFLWFNFRVCFLEPACWSGRFPFVHDIAAPPLPKGSGGVFEAFGVLTNIPVVWLALTAPLTWRGRAGEAGSILRWFVAGVGLLFGTSALTLCLHDSMWLRYEAEFACTLVLLAVMGMFGLERALASRPGRRLAVRLGWGLLLGLSVSFSLFVMFERAGETYVYRGVALLREGQLDEAAVQFQKALQIQSGNPRAQSNLGWILFIQGKAPEGIRYLEEALRLKPDLAQAHSNLGAALCEQGQLAEAIGHLEEALRLKPNLAQAHDSLGYALLREGKVAEAIGHLEEALRLEPDIGNAHHNLAAALFNQGKVSEAIGHLEQARRAKPDDAVVRKNLVGALIQLGDELAAKGKLEEAIQQYERAVEVKPDQAQTHESLGLTLRRRGRAAEAVAHYRKALELDPQMASALNNLAWILATETNVAIRNVKEAVWCAERACELTTNAVAIYLDTLGVAYSEAGRLSQSVQASERGAALARAAGNKDLAALIESRLRHYREGQPYHAIPDGAEP